MSDATSELNKHHRQLLEKRVYYLLAAAAAGIALAIQVTSDEPVQWSQIPLAGAVLCWSVSFFSGFQITQKVAEVTSANILLNKFESQASQDPRRVAESKNLRAGIEAAQSIGELYVKRQFKLLVAGAFLFLTWHIVEMAIRSNADPQIVSVQLSDSQVEVTSESGVVIVKQ